MEKKTRHIVVPKHKANAVKEMLCEITGVWPFSSEYGDDIYVQTEMTDEEVAQADHRLEMIL